MAIKAGTIADFSGSLAAAMEDALKAEYLAVKGEPLPDQGVEDRRMLLVAVAQGVARYLKSNTDAWQISELCLRQAPFVVIAGKDRRLVRPAAVAELSPRIGGIDGMPEDGQEICVADDARIIGNLHGLSMPCSAGGHLFVSWVWCYATGITRDCP